MESRPRRWWRAVAWCAGAALAAGCGGPVPVLGQQEQAVSATPVTPLDPTTIPKFVDPLPIPPVYQTKVRWDCKGRSEHLTVRIRQFRQQLLPDTFPESTVWGYAGPVKDGCGGTTFFEGTPGATFEATRFVPIHVRWVNDLGRRPSLFAVDPTLNWANPRGLPTPTPPFPPFPPGFPLAQRPVPIVTHLHGGEDAPDSDGGPLAWFTSNGITGPGFVTTRYTYPNQQPPTTLFYHDHALGMTRLNVQAGLAGFYLLRDPRDRIARFLPSGPFEIPIALQDRSFNSDGSILYPSVGPNPDIHPYWVPEFFGNSILVNGKTWPNLDVERREYRLRIVNGSNARFYDLFLSNGQSFVQIGGDGGYLPRPVTLDHALIAPGERIDVLVDFSGLRPGTRVVLENDAPTPFPTGTPVDPQTTGQLMQFTVVRSRRVPPKPLPAVLNVIPTLTPTSTRVLTLNEVAGPNGPLAVLLNGQPFDAPASETPRVGATEDWVIVNMTADTHPIHLHLVQFQLISRQTYDVTRYTNDWTTLNGDPPLDHPTIPLSPATYLTGNPVGPDPNETGWKDTVRMNPGEVTVIRVRFAPIDAPPAPPGTNQYPFDPTAAPGYVWHCHILEHEDNEMMRPLLITP